MRYEPDYKARTRQKVLAEAAKTLRSEGLQGMGVASVMGKAGLTHGAFYAHFESKDDLVAETIKAMILEARGKFDRVAAELPPAEALRAYIEFYLSARHRDNTQSSCPLPWIAGEIPRLGEASAARYGASVAGLTEILAGRLRALDHADADGTGRCVDAGAGDGRQGAVGFDPPSQPRQHPGASRTHEGRRRRVSPGARRREVTSEAWPAARASRRRRAPGMPGRARARTPASGGRLHRSRRRSDPIRRSGSA